MSSRRGAGWALRALVSAARSPPHLVRADASTSALASATSSSTLARRAAPVAACANHARHLSDVSVWRAWKGYGAERPRRSRPTPAPARPRDPRDALDHALARCATLEDALALADAEAHRLTPTNVARALYRVRTTLLRVPSPDGLRRRAALDLVRGDVRFATLRASLVDAAPRLDAPHLALALSALADVHAIARLPGVDPLRWSQSDPLGRVLGDALARVARDLDPPRLAMTLSATRALGPVAFRRHLRDDAVAALADAVDANAARCNAVESAIVLWELCQGAGWRRRGRTYLGAIRRRVSEDAWRALARCAAERASDMDRRLLAMTMEAVASHPNLPRFVEETPGGVRAFEAAARRVAAEVDDWRGDDGVAIRRRRLGFAPPNATNANDENADGGDGGGDEGGDEGGDGVPRVPMGVPPRVPPTECEAIAAGCARLGVETPEAWSTPPPPPPPPPPRRRRARGDEKARGERREARSRTGASAAWEEEAEDGARGEANDPANVPAEDAARDAATPRIDLAELPPMPPRRA